MVESLRSAVAEARRHDAARAPFEQRHAELVLEPVTLKPKAAKKAAPVEEPAEAAPVEAAPMGEELATDAAAATDATDADTDTERAGGDKVAPQ